MRKVLAMTLLLASATVGVSGARAGARASAARRPPATPFPVGRIAGAGVDGAPSVLPDSIRAVTVYVTDTCPYCAQELKAWGEALESDPRLRPPTVVISPESHVDDISWLPGALRSSWIHDSTGDVARRLQVRAVPHTAVVERGFVTQVYVGRSSDAVLRELIEATSPSEGGEH